MTVSCPGVQDVMAYVKTNTPTGASLGTVTYGTGTDGNGLYESIFTFGSTAVQNVLNAGFTTVQISWGTPFNSNQPDGWVKGPGGFSRLHADTPRLHNGFTTTFKEHNPSLLRDCEQRWCRSARLRIVAVSYQQCPLDGRSHQWTSGRTARLGLRMHRRQDRRAVWISPSLGTCFGTADAPVWDPAYDPTATTGSLHECGERHSAAGRTELLPRRQCGSARGALYNFTKTHVNLVFGGADNSSAFPIGQDWFNNITSTKTQACVAGGLTRWPIR